jgi:hypothetical protein
MSFYRYEGFWEGGLMKGQGTLTYKDGRKHIGFFDNGMHGRGVLYARGEVRSA